MEQLETISQGRLKYLKKYSSPKFTQHLVDVSAPLLVKSVEKTVNDNGMKEKWEEEETNRNLHMDMVKIYFNLKGGK